MLIPLYFAIYLQVNLNKYKINMEDIMELIKRKLGPLGNIEFDKLFIGQILSHFADAILQFLLVAILIKMLGNAGKSIAIMFFTFLLPQFLLSPFSGAFCDRISRKLILSLSCLFRAIAVICLIFCIQNLNIGLIYLFSFIFGTGAAFFYPAKMSAVTNVVKSSQLKFANAMTSAIGSIALLFGAILSKYLIAYGEIKAFGTIAVMYFIAFLLTGFINFIIPQNYFVKKSGTPDAIIALKYLQKHRKVFHIVGLLICLQFIVAVFSNSLNALITD